MFCVIQFKTYKRLACTIKILPFSHPTIKRSLSFIEIKAVISDDFALLVVNKPKSYDFQRFTLLNAETRRSCRLQLQSLLKFVPKTTLQLSTAAKLLIFSFYSNSYNNFIYVTVSNILSSRPSLIVGRSIMKRLVRLQATIVFYKVASPSSSFLLIFFEMKEGRREMLCSNRQVD